MDFTDYAATIADECFTAELGQDGTYNGSTAVRVMISREVLDIPDDFGRGVVAEQFTTVRFRNSEIASPQRGDTIAVGVGTYTLHKRIQDDYYVSTWTVK